MEPENLITFRFIGSKDRIPNGAGKSYRVPICWDVMARIANGTSKNLSRSDLLGARIASQMRHCAAIIMEVRN